MHPFESIAIVPAYPSLVRKETRKQAFLRLSVALQWREMCAVFSEQSGEPPRPSIVYLYSETLDRRGLVEIYVPQQTLRPYGLHLFFDPSTLGELYARLVAADCYDQKDARSLKLPKIESNFDLELFIGRWISSTKPRTKVFPAHKVSRLNAHTINTPPDDQIKAFETHIYSAPYTREHEAHAQKSSQ